MIPKWRLARKIIALALTLLAPAGVVRAQSGIRSMPNLTGFPDRTGIVRTFNENGSIDLTGPFFQSLGTNGRSCGSCHQLSDAMSIAAANVELRFNLTLGTDPIFRTNDGSNCNHSIDVSSFGGRREAYSLLRTRGLIRIALAVPAGADFQVVNVNNPYG
jgi:hypothetical protein